MNYIHRGHNNLHLVSRNEGKIKSYESCTDVRAWNHDIMRRDCFLREWMKSDMPNSIISVHALVGILETMTGRRWVDGLKAIPKCHPNCKSKVVLQSICASCHVMKECLKNDTDFDKFFAEEEFETCNWPCERCLEVLKSIKLFWKIIMEKIFGISNLKCEELDTAQNLRGGSIQSVAKTWEKGMVKQALLVKSIASNIAQKSKLETKCICYNHNNINERSPQKTCQMNKGNTIRSLCTKGTNAHVPYVCPCIRIQSDDTSEKKISKCTFVKVKTEDIACDTSNVEKENDEIKAYKHNVQLLREELMSQKNEMESLKRENKYLKLDLENFYKSFTVKSRCLTPGTLADKDNSVVPTPFEDCNDCGETADVVGNIESEIIITLENCKNKDYKYVSLLKVLHKTNIPVNGNVDRTEQCYIQDNPMDILTKVQNTFGALVKREMGIADKANTSKRFEISASFHKVNSSKSAPLPQNTDFSSGSK